MFVDPSSTLHRPKLGVLLHSDLPSSPHVDHEHDLQSEDSDYWSQRPSSASGATSSTVGSPYMTSPLNYQGNTSPYNKSPWLLPSTPPKHLKQNLMTVRNGLVGSLVREEGHIYSLAVAGDLLYTGSDSKNIRVWKDLKDFTGFKSRSGLVKSIIISGKIIFTGHQDGKIRIWKVSRTNPTNHRRIGSLPTLREYVKSSVIPKSKGRHYDAVSSLSLDEDQGLLYSASWDKTVKVWSISDSRFLESIEAHSDAVNAVVAAFGCYVFTGSADGTVKMWRREYQGKKGITMHVLEEVLLDHESAVTALAVNRWSMVLYGGSSDGVVRFWGMRRCNNKKHGFCQEGVLRGHKLAVLCVAVAGNLVVSGSADKSVCVWKRDEESGKHAMLSVLNGHSGPVKCIAAIQVEEEEESYGWMVYTGSLDNSVKVWRVLDNVPPLQSPLEVTAAPARISVINNNNNRIKKDYYRFIKSKLTRNL
ncbi:protein JINGUBANG-like [Arachis stenosperma]|uniref:protein JINGUBANG-like n=1 Tax=Arachis stenosperma TaxID=217475 RepID=UPI0025AD6B24|nr:protein JINGUBANG-like [Arachis stenosperma]